MDYKFYKLFQFLLIIYLLISVVNVRADYSGAALPSNSITLSIPSNQVCNGQQIKITLSTSELGVSYQLYSGITSLGNPKQGTGNSIFFLISPTSTATYSVRATNSEGTVNLANTVTVTVNAAPNLAYTLSKNRANPICESLGAQVTLSLSGSETGVTYKVIDNANAINSISFAGTGSAITVGVYSPTQNRTYKVFAEKSGCYLQDTLFVNDNETISVIPLPDTTFDLQVTNNEICVTESTQVSLANTESGTDYTLKYGASVVEKKRGTGGAMSFAVTSPVISQVYSVIANNPTCNVDRTMSEKINLKVGVLPDRDLFPSLSKDVICRGTEITPFLETTNSMVKYQLYIGNTAVGNQVQGNEGKISFPIQAPTANTIYRFKAKGRYCINAIDIPRTVAITVHQPPQTNRVLSSNKDTICKGEEVKLKINGSESGIYYQLHDGNSLIGTDIIGTGGTIYFPNQKLNANKTYSLRAHEAICTTKIALPTTKAIHVLNFDSAPIETISTPDEICMGSKIAIEIPTTTAGVEYVLENNGVELNRIKSKGSAVVFKELSPNEQTNYKVTIGNCVEKLVVATPRYTLHTNPQLQLMKKDVTTGYNGSVSVAISEGTPPFTYFFNPLGSSTSNSRVKEYTNLKEGDYTVLVVDTEACRSSQNGEKVTIGLDKNKQVVVNNVMTPNGDGVNDTWKIHYQSTLGNPEVYVFNIYGQEVYHSKSYQNDWNGKFKGNVLPNGAYYYLIEFPRGNVGEIKGSLSILGNN
jgi:gliding motility-associated-like protein